MVHGNLEINEPLEGFECPPDHGAEVVNAFSNENIDLEGWRSVAVRSRGDSDTFIPTFFCPAQRSIFCAYNDKTKDHNDSKDRLEWSDIVSQIYQMEAARALQSPKLLRTVWRFWIVNPDTDTILGQTKSFDNPIDEGLSYTEYRPGDGDDDSGFFALLGCPNGGGVVRMLTDHCSALGHKTITSVRVLDSSDSLFPPTMYFVLADCDIAAPVTKSKRSIAGQRRQAKRHPGQVQGPVSFGNS